MSESGTNKEIYDVVGVGIGPANLSLSALLTKITNCKSIFFDSKSKFSWHEGMLLPEATIQVSFLKDLVTLVDPSNRFSFLSFLAETGRLYRFINAQFPRVKRREFNQYFQWASQLMDNLAFNKTVVDIDVEPGHLVLTQHDGTSVMAKNIVMGIGQNPKVPAFAEPYLHDHVIHSKDFLATVSDLRGKKIAVIGGGQSGAEIVSHILDSTYNIPDKIYWISRRSNFLPLDDSPFINEFFTPSYNKYFYALPFEEKKRLLNEQLLASDGIDMELLRTIYRRLYEIELIENRQQFAVLLPNTCVKDMTICDHSILLNVESRQNIQDAIEADLVVLATGYESRIQPFMKNILKLTRPGKEGNFCINSDFSIQWDHNDSGRIYIQNAARLEHGIADPNLSLLSWRSAKIINGIAGRQVYNTNNETLVIKWEDQQNSHCFKILPYG